MNILILSFFYHPDLSAGSFRNTALVEAIQKKLGKSDSIDVIATFPNRYHTYKTETKHEEQTGNVRIRRITISQHKNGFADQILSFQMYFRQVLKLTKNQKYDLVYASSSKLFTAFLGAVISRSRKIPLYLDLRDIFVDTINDVIKSKLLKMILLPVLRRIELFTYKNASHINLVSEGFKEYYEKVYDGPVTYYSNGIDDEFLEVPSQRQDRNNSQKVITYAGNIGEGQGLEKVIPEAALELGDKYLFQIIGDGGTRQKLTRKLEELRVSNVKLIPPVSRKELIDYYMNSDYLFLHLNNYKAFEKVLPSKIFEYGATRKKIIAGVSGYSKVFLESNLPDSIIFEPGNYNEFLLKIKSDSETDAEREQFISKFKRSAIIERMAESVIQAAGSENTWEDYYLIPDTLQHRSEKI